MRTPFVYVLGALSVAAIVTAFLVVGPASAPQAQERVVTAQKGVVQSTVSGSGNLESAKQVDLNFATSGTVTRIYVEAGDQVVEGQKLAEVDSRAAEVALAQARADYEEAQDALDAAESANASTSSSSGSSTATSAVASASQAQQPPDTETETTPTETTPTETETTPTQTETTPTQTETATTPSQSGDSGSSGSGSTGSTGSTTSVASAQAKLESADLAVEQAEDDLADTVLYAPANGTIAEVNGAVGESSSASSSSSSSSSDSDSSAAAPTGNDSSSSSSSSSDSGGSAFMTLVQPHRLNLEVSFSESDIGKLRVGQAATVSVDALSDVQLAAKVVSIGMLSTTSNGVVEYPVTLALTQRDNRLKPGMTASADVVVSQVDGAVSVPSQAVSGGGRLSTVTVRRSGKDVTQPVTTGLEGDDSTEIVSGLKAGDEVVMRTTTVSATGQTGAGQIGSGQTGTLGGRGGFGGGGLGGGGFGGGPPGGGGGPP
jgi:multidrug efflux pump subunit AcrA (membrane-fusion protein)